MNKNNKASLTVIFFTVFIDLMGFGILIPILPTFASKELGVSDFGIGLLIASFSFVQFLFNPIMGRISDRIGRRPVIIISLSITALSYVLFSFSHSYWMVLLSRILAGFGGSNIGVAQAYIADITPKEERSKGMGLIGAAFGLGFLFGPLVGGLLSHYSYMVAGLGSAGFSTLALIFAFTSLPESIKEKQISKIKLTLFDFKFIKTTLKHPSVGLLMILFFTIIFSIANIYGTFAILGYKVYHFSDQQNSYFYGIMGIVGAAMQGGFIRILTIKFQDRSLVLFGLVLMMIGLAFIPFGGNFLGLAIIIIILSIGTGTLQPVVLSMVSKYAPDKQQGAILGLNQSFSSFARVLGPLWGGFSYDFLGYQFPFLTGAAFTFLALIASVFLLNSKRLKAEHESNV
ncbi:MAG: MFS transporter [bacterium]